MDIFKVVLAKLAKRNLLRVPLHVTRKLQAWIEMIENEGLIATRKIPGYHDEPLHGTRLGQRSIRLSKAYRAIYVINLEGNIQIIKVLEVNKHDY